MTKAKKFNKGIAKDIISLYENGLSKSRCADYVGINRKTIYSWFNKGRDSEDPEDDYYKFYKGMMEAKAKFIMYHQEKINNNQDWRASKYLLEVTDPDTYVLEKRLNVKTENETKVELDNESIFDIVDKELGIGKYKKKDNEE